MSQSAYCEGCRKSECELPDLPLPRLEDISPGLRSYLATKVNGQQVVAYVRLPAGDEIILVHAAFPDGRPAYELHQPSQCALRQRGPRYRKFSEARHQLDLYVHEHRGTWDSHDSVIDQLPAASYSPAMRSVHAIAELWFDGVCHGAFREARVLQKIVHFLPNLTTAELATIAGKITRMRSFDTTRGARPLVLVYTDGRVEFASCSDLD